MVQKLKTGKYPGKYVLGITGSFGTGKSTAAKFFGELGAKVIDSDAIAHEALQPGSPVFEKILDLLGTQILDASGKAGRKKIAELIFSDPQLRQRLEEVIHPFVFKRLDEEIKKSSEKVVAVEVPLLFETGYEKQCDAVAVVDAPHDVRNERLRQKGFSLEEVTARLEHQMPLEDKKRLADFIIINGGDLNATGSQVRRVWEKIKSASEKALHLK